MPNTQDREPLLRQLTVLGIWGLAINGTIGAGIFSTPGNAAEVAGIYSPLLFLLCGLLLAPVVLSFAEVASSFRVTGGTVLYVQSAFGPLAGFQTGWAFYVARISASAANLSVIITTLAYFWPAADDPWPRRILLTLMCAMLTWVNIVGAKHAMRSLGLLTILKFVPLLAVALYGLTQFDSGAFPFAETPTPSATTLGAGVMVVIYAYVGWESAVVLGGETRNPARDMPRALLWALGTATVLYIVIQTVSVAVLPGLAETEERPLVEVGVALFGPVGAAFLTFGVIVSIAGNVTSAAMSTPRITYAMARSQLLPSFFGATHAEYKTPWVSVLIYGAFTLVLAVSGTFLLLATISVLTRLLIYIAVIAALPRVRRQTADNPDVFRLRGGMAIPAVGAIVCTALAFQVNMEALVSTAACLAVGWVLFLATRWAVRRSG